ncbi:Clp protease N-terminal domain-containing protein [Allokutzneria albata]|uniref:Clp amino terminal domain-containing protein, pathogenicity island component n=1 Tax=Allokutzneria albata TaxID=211114 RepID=A0A1G9WXL0_ALLAB|nr:Clp protease N-terminal domain-containing protein [Allokutzneria albata]SDM89238.1 Clp amino terminal domain-containing protein, pathogenicity island component [Allokutzneria albata]
MTPAPARLDDLITYVKTQYPDGTPLDHLSVAVLTAERLGELADHLIGHFVDQARRGGASWTEIGQSMGVSKQAAQKRFVPKDMDKMTMDSFARYTDDARKVLVYAQEEAKSAGNPEIGTEHILLGLLHAPEALAARALAAEGASEQTVRAAVERVLPPAQQEVPEQIPFTANAKKVIQLTLRESLRHNSKHIGTEHLLLALMRAESGTGAKVVADLGISRQAVEDRIHAELQQS